jgi:uncharacterized BrkB/YihY/UPF0761 family membrane protein
MNRGLTLLIALVVMALGVAMAGTLEEDAAKNTANIMCPIVNLLTGTLIRLVIIVLLAAAIASYFLVDARAAKTTAITLAIGALLVMNFATLQKLFTGYELTTDNTQQTSIDIANKKIVCGK